MYVFNINSLYLYMYCTFKFAPIQNNIPKIPFYNMLASLGICTSVGMFGINKKLPVFLSLISKTCLPIKIKIF